jgi:hypothetical protein
MLGWFNAATARASRSQHLERDVAVELGVLRLPDLAHPALADLLDQAVVEQLLSGFDGHRSVSPHEIKA